MSVGGLDQPLLVTFFRDFAAKTLTAESVSLRALKPRIETITAESKKGLPWLKLARFGENRNPDSGSFRHDANVKAVTGLEADYDGEQMLVIDAVEKLGAAGVLAMVYTSPSHTEDTPRFRVICPFSRELPPEARSKMLGRLNGLFGGIFSGESWTLSQAYYYGSVMHNPSHQVHLIDGEPIDTLTELDLFWAGKPNTTTRVTAAGERVSGPVDEAALLAEITSGASYHASAMRLLGKWAVTGVSLLDARERLTDAFDMVFPADRDERWTARRADVDRSLMYVFGKEAKKRDEAEQHAPLLKATPEPPPGYYDSQEAPAAQPAAPPEPQQAPSDAPPPLPVIYFGDVAPALDAADFVEGLLISSSMGVVYGQSNSGKTFWMSDLALHVAAGMMWREREVDRGGVLWLAMEGSMGIQNRVAAWKMRHKIADDIPFAIVPVALNLLDPEADTGRLIETIGIVAKRLGRPVALTVVDTLSRAMAGGNENAPDDMGALVTNGTAIQQETHSAVVWIHHSGKDEAKGARGHSLLRAATDTEIEITADGPMHNAEVTKQRELPCTGVFPFQLTVIELGKNRRGKPVTSCVVEPSDDGLLGGHERPHLKGHPKRALEVLHVLLAESGTTGHVGLPPGVVSVQSAWWRERFYETAMPGAMPEAKQKAFRRAADDLVAQRIVGMRNDRVWIVYPEPPATRP